MAPLEKTFLAEEGKPHVTMTMLFDRWNRAQVRRPKTVAEYKTVSALFEVYVRQHFKIREVAHVTKAHVVAFRDRLSDGGESYKTVQKKVGIVKSIFSRAVSDDVLKSNPGDRVKVTAPHVSAKPRVSFTGQDLKAIFTSNIYRSNHELAGCGRASLFWLPLIGLFTGMRLEEICQLRAGDIRKDPQLGWYFSVNDEDGKTVKTHSSRRNVPVHAELKRIGFLTFAGSTAPKGARLFADLTVDKYGRRGSRFSKQWNKHLRTVLGLQDGDRSRSFHSFRHTFKDNCRRMGMSEEIHDALTGHRTGATEGRRYGSGTYPLPPLFRAMQTYRLHGLKLSQLRWANLPNGKKVA
jgi:integrase